MAARGEQPTPSLCARLLFAALHSLIVIFASSNLQHNLCVDAAGRPDCPQPTRIGGLVSLPFVPLYVSAST